MCDLIGIVINNVVVVCVCVCVCFSLCNEGVLPCVIDGPPTMQK